MLDYIIKRLLLIIPTLFCIMLLNFVIIQLAPGGPIQQIIAKLSDTSSSLNNHFGGEDSLQQAQSSQSQNALGNGAYSGIDEEFLKKLEKQFGFDKPLMERFWHMLLQYIRLDFGTSYYKHQKVLDIIFSKLPTSITLGLWTMICIHLIAIPLGIRKAVRHGTRFDMISSSLVIVAYAIPSFLGALFLMTFFAEGGVFEIFPLRGLTSTNINELSWSEKIVDYLWHIVLPITAMTLGSLAKSVFLTKNCFLEEFAKQYVLTARAKGLSMRSVLYRHIFKNALLIVLSHIPSALLAILFTSSLLIEILFSLDGLGLLGYEAAVSRDYPVIFGCLFIFTLIGMILHLLNDLLMTYFDKRIQLHI